MTHDILDPFGETRVVAVTKDLVIPMGAYCELVELDIVLDNLLVVLHFQVIDHVFGIGGRVYGAKLGSEGVDEVTKADQLSIHTGYSSSSKREGSKNSKAVPQRYVSSS